MAAGVSPTPARGVRTSIYVDGFEHDNPIPAAARIGNLVFSSRINGKDPSTGKIPAAFQEQCRLLFSHMRAIVEAAGGTTADIIKVSLWVTDRNRRDEINAEWVAMFPDPASRPARHSIEAELDGGKLVVADFVAVLGDDRGAAPA